MSKEEYRKLAFRWFPKRWKFEPRKALSGRCYYSRRTISAPQPNTLRALHIFLHECAHAYLHGCGERIPSHRREYEAETWAFNKMREAGFEPHPESIERAKRYVRRKIEFGIKCGAKGFDHEAALWCGYGE